MPAWQWPLAIVLPFVLIIGTMVFLSDKESYLGLSWLHRRRIRKLGQRGIAVVLDKTEKKEWDLLIVELEATPGERFRTEVAVFQPPLGRRHRFDIKDHVPVFFIPGRHKDVVVDRGALDRQDDSRVAGDRRPLKGRQAG